MAEMPDGVALEVLRFYARQSRLIDGGDAAGWAATFSPDGVFESPSYERPSRGRAELTSFAARYADRQVADGVVSRHVVTNVDVVAGADADTVTAFAYLQIVTTPRGGASRLERLTTITDRLVRGAGGQWLVAHRRVARDDVANGSESEDR